MSRINNSISFSPWTNNYWNPVRKFDCLQEECSRAQAFVVRVHSDLYGPFTSVAYHYHFERCFYLIVAPLLQSFMFIQKVFKTKKKNFPEDKAIVVHVHNDLCCCCLHSSMAGWLYLLLLAYLITHSSRTSCFLASFILIAYFDICTYLYFGWLVHFACSATSILFLITLHGFSSLKLFELSS